MPANRTGPDPKITPTMGDALCLRLAKEPDMNLREMADFINEEFDKEVSVTTIFRTLNWRKISYKVMRRVAQQQMPDLQHFYYYRLKMLGCRSYHVVFVDESGISRPGMFQRKGRSPKGIAPVQKAKFERRTRVQFIAAYTQRGVKLCRFFTRSMNKPLFEDFNQTIALSLWQMARAGDRTYYG